MRIAVAGGTGVVGRHVAAVATERGHEVVVLSRREGVDLTSGEGLDRLADRLAGSAAVVDVSGTRSQTRRGAEGFFTGVTTHLLDAETAAGVGHHVALSIVGVDLVDTGYYAGKRAQEALVTQGRVPWTLLRATQFHEFAEQVLGFVRVGPWSWVPRMASQPVAAREVGEALVDAVEAGPGGRVPELAGPEPLEMVEMARRVSAARGLGRRVVPVRLPGAGGRAMAGGALRPREPGRRGRIGFDEWLAGRSPA